MWYMALTSLELRLARVRTRVSRNSHDIPSTRSGGVMTQSGTNLLELASPWSPATVPLQPFRGPLPGSHGSEDFCRRWSYLPRI
jgi:hypothetical protein